MNVHLPAEKKRPSFSKASHFALILAPVALGVAYAYTQDTAATAPVLLGVTFLFAVGLGGALALLKGVEEIEAWELNAPPRRFVATEETKSPVTGMAFK